MSPMHRPDPSPLAGTAPSVLIRNALVFDGLGGPPRLSDVLVRRGQVDAVAARLDVDADEVVDAQGHWLMPGLWDIHTHLDLEVELDPSLAEVVRHGTTTAVVANCSIGVAFGRQQKDGHDPVVSCFARVENVPKPVLRKVADQIDWTDTQGYLDHFLGLPMGANVVPLVPYSMLRIEVMGVDAAVSRPATEDELERMEQLLEDALAQGYAGLSTDALPFHYMSDDPHRKRKIPSHLGTFDELRRLTEVVRRHERVWQATPEKDDPLKVFRMFFLSSARLYGKALKTTAVAVLDLVNNRFLTRLAKVLSRVINSPVLRGHFRLQALGAPFKIYADGPITPIAEEIPALRELNEVDVEDRAARQAIMGTDDFRERFRRMWLHDKRGLSVGRIKRWLRMIDDSLCRDLREMVMTEHPVPDWKEETLQDVYERLVRWQRTGDGARSDAERAAFESLPSPIGDDADFLLALLRRYDTDLRWYALVANADEKVRTDLLLDPQFLPGFNDSGAHLGNMAFYDANLRSLQLAQKRGEAVVGQMVHRLTRVPADFWGFPGVGAIAPGQRADLVLVDPDALAAYDSEARTIYVPRDALGGARQMLNRSDGVVTDVWVGGHRAWRDARPAPALGQVKMGRALTVGPSGPSPAMTPLRATDETLARPSTVPPVAQPALRNPSP